MAVTRSIGSDGLEVLSNILDQYTGESLIFKEVTSYVDGTPMDDSKLDPSRVIYIKKYGKYFRRVVNGGARLQWWGAKNDRSFNSTPLIQEALDTCAIVGESINVDDTFYTFLTLNIPSNTHIYGIGGFAKTQDFLSISVTNIGDWVVNVKIEDITIDSCSFFEAQKTTNANSCLRIMGVAPNNIKINRVKFRGAGRDGIYINDHLNQIVPSNISITDCDFYGISRNGISVINGEGISITRSKFEKWNLCAIDMEPNQLLVPLRNVLVHSSIFIKPEDDNSTISATITGDDVGNKDLHYGITISNNVVKGSGFGGMIKVNKFYESRIIDNICEDFTGQAITTSGDGALIRGNLIKNNFPATYEASRLNSGAITCNGNYSIVEGNIIDNVSYSGIYIGGYRGVSVRNNIISNVGMATGYSGTLIAHIKIDSCSESEFSSNQLIDTKETPSVTYAIVSTITTGREGYDNIFKDNYHTPNILPYNIASVNRQRLVCGNGKNTDAIKNGGVVTTLPTPTSDLLGKVYKLRVTGQTDRNYICIQNAADGYVWEDLIGFNGKSIKALSVSEYTGVASTLDLNTLTDGFLVHGSGASLINAPYSGYWLIQDIAHSSIHLQIAWKGLTNSSTPGPNEMHMRKYAGGSWTSWTSIGGVNATTLIKGLVNQATAVPDIVAPPVTTIGEANAQIQALSAKVNELLAAMRTAGLLDP